MGPAAGAGALEVRVFDPAPESAEVLVAGHSGWLVDLRGRPLGCWQERFELRPWAFATARLDARSLDEARRLSAGR